VHAGQLEVLRIRRFSLTLVCDPCRSRTTINLVERPELAEVEVGSVDFACPPERLARFPPFPGWIAARLEPVGAELHKMVSAWSSRSRAKRRLVPKKSNVAENRARAVCIELARATGNRPMQYRMVRPIVMAAGLDDAAADAAIAYAVDKGWLVTDIAEEGPPLGICLTDAGRRLVAGR
jgi:hypothetical protein